MVNEKLPDLILFQGNWESYVEKIYQLYLDRVVNGHLSFGDLPIRCRYHPASREKGFGFWHVIQSGPREDDRVPDLRRCERILWIPWIINKAKKDSRVTWWEERRGSSIDILLWLEAEDYLVVLARRSDYLLLKTAYCTEKPHKQKTLRKSRAKFQELKKD